MRDPGRGNRFPWLLLTFVAVTDAHAQTPQRPIILSLPSSVRFAGLGGAGVAVNGDAGSVFTNPAGLATVRNIALEGAFHRYPDGSIENMGAAAVRLFQFDLGGGYRYFRISDTTSPVRDNFAWVGSVVYRYGFIAAGVTGKYMSLRDSARIENRALSADVGLAIHVFDILSIAASMQNLGNHHVSGGPLDLPRTTRVGFTFNFVDPQSSARLLGTLETIWTRGESRRTLLGAEAGVVFHGVGVVGRVGYGAQGIVAGQRQAAFGGGLVISRARIDYAYQRGYQLGGHVHRVGVRFTL